MNTHSPSGTTKVQAYQVRSPRPTDALKGALRDAYPRANGLPEDMIVILRHLSRYD